MKSSQTPTHIALVLPSLSGGGAERVFVTLANEFKKNIQRVDLVVTSSHNSKYLNEIDEDVNVIFFHKKRMLYGIIPLIKYFRKDSPDVVLCAIGHCIAVTYISLILSSQRKTTKIFARITESVSSKKHTRLTIRSFLMKKALKLIYNNVNGIICLTNDMAKELKEYYDLKRHIEKIANPAITSKLLKDSYERIEKPLPWDTSAADGFILSAGRLTDQKDYSTLINAFVNVRKNKNINLVILGEGPKRGELQTLAEDLGVGEHIWLPGFLDNPFPYLRKASVFVLTSKWEGLPNILIQALACGTPVISSDCPTGPRDILANGSFGKLVPIGDIREFSNSIDEVLSLGTHKTQVPQSHLSNYRSDVIADQYLNCIANN